ncbi:MAG TPA: bifunctional riboflavin kinase/FAD synthetase [Polyangiaceae bacterium]|nr:bifunctional riboflavin kinase/FAD synthetase [Polyangiaceae bacterium]
MSQRVYHGIGSFDSATASVVAIGNFDGVHRGHQRVLTSACALARREGLLPVVLTFDPHPAEVLAGAKLARLTSLSRKVELLLRQDPELVVVVEPFVPELALMTPEDFAAEMLAHGLGARHVLVGENFRFGHQRRGDLALLSKLGERLGFRAAALDLFGDAGGSYSSTRVREALALGDLASATAILGRPHALVGSVVVGDRRGRTLGFPTANLDGVAEQLPKNGVYATAVDLEGSDTVERLALGALNIGVRPTVGAGPSTEVHLLDFSGDLYGKTLRVHLMHYLRSEQRFDGLPALVRQLEADVERVRRELGSLCPAADAGGAWF